MGHPLPYLINYPRNPWVGSKLYTVRVFFKMKSNFHAAPLQALSRKNCLQSSSTINNVRLVQHGVIRYYQKLINWKSGQRWASYFMPKSSLKTIYKTSVDWLNLMQYYALCGWNNSKRNPLRWFVNNNIYSKFWNCPGRNWWCDRAVLMD